MTIVTPTNMKYVHPSPTQPPLPSALELVGVGFAPVGSLSLEPFVRVDKGCH